MLDKGQIVCLNSEVKEDYLIGEYQVTDYGIKTLSKKDLALLYESQNKSTKH
jgi:hypothetical protein